MGPGTIGMAATQINVFVNTVLATGEGTGAVSWLDFAFRLMYLPIGLFGVSIATAATPAISRMVAEQDFARIRSTLANALGADAVPERAGHRRPRDSCRADRRGDLSTRRVHGRRHDCHRPRAAVVCDWSGGLLDRPNHLADVLRAAAEPDSGDGLGGVGRGQRRAQPDAGAGDGLPRPRARHVDHRAHQCHGAAVAAAPRDQRPRRRADRRRRRFASSRRRR